MIHAFPIIFIEATSHFTQKHSRSIINVTKHACQPTFKASLFEGTRHEKDHSYHGAAYSRAVAWKFSRQKSLRLNSLRCNAPSWFSFAHCLL